jgi:RNA polymerase sigma-70 factor (ECF subfamily)
MADGSSFDDLMTRLRAGDEEAARQIYNRFLYRLLARVRSRLNARLRQKLDPEEVVQSALNSFFRRYAEGQFELTNWDSLLSLLGQITLRKCGHQIEYFRAARRDVQREQALAADEGSACDWEVMGREPTPHHEAVLQETIEHLANSLDDDRERMILSLSLEGCDKAEISERVGRSERTVDRVLTRIRKRLERLRDES